MRKLEDYLKLDKTRDVIEWQLDDTLDISGWDLKKALQLMHESNPSDRKSTRLNSSHIPLSRMPSSA